MADSRSWKYILANCTNIEFSFHTISSNGSMDECMLRLLDDVLMCSGKSINNNINVVVVVVVVQP